MGSLLSGIFGGGAQGASGTGTGSMANVYTPTAQPAADQMYQNIVQNLYNQGFGPAGQNYPTAQGFVDRYMTGSPYMYQAQAGANAVADYSGQFFPYQAGSGYSLQGAGNTAMAYGDRALQQGYDPTYHQMVEATTGNPYYQGALTGANQAANIGGQWASNLQNPLSAGVAAASPLLANAQGAIDYGKSVYGGAAPIQSAAQDIYGKSGQLWNAGRDIYGQAAPIMGFARGVADKSGDVWNAAQNVANTAFDPQSALFNRLQSQTLDQQNVINSMSNVASSPYGAGITGDAMRNLNIDWENQKLARQQTGLGALGQGLTAQQAGLGALGTGYNVLNQGLGALGQGLQGNIQGLGALGTGQQALGYGADAYNRGLNAYSGALGGYNSALTSALQGGAGTASLAAQSAALPGQTYQNQIQNVLSALQAQQKAGIAGSSAFDNLLRAGAQGYQTGAGLQNNALQQYLAGTQAPYNTGIGFANNALTGLQNVTNLGNQQYGLPSNLLNAISAYLKLGQGASDLSGQLGNMGFQQTAQGIGGLLSGANSLFGRNSLLGGSQGIFGPTGISSLFGGGVADAGFNAAAASSVLGGAGEADLLASALIF